MYLTRIHTLGISPTHSLSLSPHVHSLTPLSLSRPLPRHLWHRMSDWFVADGPQAAAAAVARHRRHSKFTKQMFTKNLVLCKINYLSPFFTLLN